MSIKFVCSCGKHLRARDEMAARRSMCPRCGQPVGVPSLLPTHAGTAAAPLTPQERRRLNRDKPSSDAFTTGATAALTADPPVPPPKPGKTPRVRRRRQLEQHWYQCLAYPFLNWPMLLVLSAISTIWLAGVLFAIPNMPRFSMMSLPNALPWIAGAVVLLLLVVYAYATVECALTSALAGNGPGPYWPGWSAAFPVKSVARWFVCFFAGPIVPVGMVIYFCLYGGDLAPLDWAIVIELSVLAAGYWFLALISANERNCLRDANPIRVAQLMQRLHFRLVVPALIAPALAFGHAWVGIFALDFVHRHVAVGWFLLMACWCSALLWSAFLFRLLGVWCYRTPPVTTAT